MGVQTFFNDDHFSFSGTYISIPLQEKFSSTSPKSQIQSQKELGWHNNNMGHHHTTPPHNFWLWQGALETLNEIATPLRVNSHTNGK